LKVVGLLNWWMESPSWLSAAVSGFARICDTIVACDGAYSLTPGARARSHPREAEAIMHAAEAGGAASIIYRPTSIWWGNELAKRNQLLRLAGTLELTDEDWVLVFDADQCILQVDPELARSRLAATDLNVATYTVLDGRDMLDDTGVQEWMGLEVPSPFGLSEYVRDRDCDSEWTYKDRNIFRWNPTLRVGPQHWLYSVKGAAGKREWVRGPNWDKDVPACDLGRDLVSYHRPEDRPKTRRETQKGYYQMREETRVEWLANHDPPEFDDESDVVEADEAAV
jgi:hypothetical protein